MQANRFIDERSTRREFLSFSTASMTSTALASMLARDARTAEVPSAAKDPPPHHKARARRVIHVCLCGGLSHLDSFSTLR